MFSLIQTFQYLQCEHNREQAAEQERGKASEGKNEG